MLMDLIKARHSIRKYTDKQISHEDLERISLIKGGEIGRVGTEALRNALGPLGMAGYLEEYDTILQSDTTVFSQRVDT